MSTHIEPQWAAPDADTIQARAETSAERQLRRNAELAPVLPTRVHWRDVILFSVIAMALAWLVALPLWLSGEGLASPWFQLIAMAMMYTPAIAAFVLVLFVRRPSSIPRLLGLAPIRPAGRTIGFMVLALVGMPVLTFVAMLVGSLLGFINLDFTGAPGIVALLQSGGAPADAGTVASLAMMQLAVIPFNALVTSIFAFGEEVGWRGWLLPNLLPLGQWPALAISGAIWGLWHAPLILLGYNFGRTDLLGVVFMMIGCVFLGVLFGWLRLRTASVWPAVIAHGALNAASASLILVFAATDQNAALVPQGTILGVAGWILLAAVTLVLVLTGQFRRRARPGLRMRESHR